MLCVAVAAVNLPESGEFINFAHNFLFLNICRSFLSCTH